MKKTKVLVPALAVLALGMAASVTGTVAWYAANTKVTGSGMSVSATVAKNLVITNSGKGSWAASAIATTTTASQLAPISTADFDDKAAYFASSDGSKVDYGTGHLNDGAVVSGVTIANWAEGVNGGSVRLDTFYVKLDALSSVHVDLKLESVTVTEPANNITKALRFGLKVGSLDSIYSVTGGDETYNALSAAGTVDSSKSSGTAYKDSSNNALTTSVTAENAMPSDTTVVSNLAGGTEVKFEIFSWYEGQDAACTSANSINPETISINFQFGYVDAA